MTSSLSAEDLQKEYEHLSHQLPQKRHREMESVNKWNLYTILSLNQRFQILEN